MNMHRSVLAAILASAAFSACRSSPPLAAYGIEDDAEQLSAVVVEDSSLRDAIRAGRPQVSRLNHNNCLRVVVPIRNIDDRQIQVLAKVSFRDRQQQPLGDDTNSQQVTIRPGDTINIETTSRSDAAQDFVVRLFWNK